jgi:predicted site-specific integrase-resolvase
LKNWRKSGRIEFVVTPSGQHRSILDAASPQTRELICYCRVSSPKQRDDLERQAAALQERFPSARIVKDIGSGLNFKRKGLLAILERALSGVAITLVVACRDRLARFGFDLIDYVIKRSGGDIVVLNQITASPTTELVSDLLAIVHGFSCRLHGLRKYKRQIKEDTDLPDGLPAVAAAPVAGNEQVALQSHTRHGFDELDRHQTGHAERMDKSESVACAGTVSNQGNSDTGRLPGENGGGEEVSENGAGTAV